MLRDRAPCSLVAGPRLVPGWRHVASLTHASLSRWRSTIRRRAPLRYGSDSEADNWQITQAYSAPTPRYLRVQSLQPGRTLDYRRLRGAIGGPHRWWRVQTGGSRVQSRRRHLPAADSWQGRVRSAAFIRWRSRLRTPGRPLFGGR